MRRCVIIASGPLGDPGPVKPLIAKDDYVICVDGGYSHALELSARPDLLVGDLDSFAGPLPQGLEVLRFQKEKDETDTVLAVDHALGLGFKDFLIVGGLKGRLDHTFANFSALLRLCRRGGRGYIADADNEAHMLLEGRMVFERREGFYLSVFPFGEEALGVTETGVKYPLKDARLVNTFPLGVSNEFAAARAVVSVKKGPLLIILSKG